MLATGSPSWIACFRAVVRSSVDRSEGDLSNSANISRVSAQNCSCRCRPSVAIARANAKSCVERSGRPSSSSITPLVVSSLALSLELTSFAAKSSFARRRASNIWPVRSSISVRSTRVSLEAPLVGMGGRRVSASRNRPCRGKFVGSTERVLHGFLRWSGRGSCITSLHRHFEGFHASKQPTCRAQQLGEISPIARRPKNGRPYVLFAVPVPDQGRADSFLNCEGCGFVGIGHQADNCCGLTCEQYVTASKIGGY